MKKFTIVRYKWQKILFIILFSIAVLANFIIITFGDGMNFVQNIIQKVRHVGYSAAVKIDDMVYMNPIDGIPMGREYLIDCYPTNTSSSLAAFRFESLTPDVFTLKNNYSSYVTSKIFDDDEMAMKMSKSAHLTASKRHNPESLEKSLLSIYQQLMEK